MCVYEDGLRRAVIKNIIIWGLETAAAKEAALHGPALVGHHEDSAQLPPKQTDLCFLDQQLTVRNIYRQLHQVG